MNQNDKQSKLELSNEEAEAEKQDRALIEAANALNGPNPKSLTELLPGFKLMNHLEYWARLGNTGKVKLVLTDGGDINAIGDEGYTALHAAAKNGHVEVARLLVEHGANVQAKTTSGQTPAMLAAGKHAEVAAFLQAVGRRFRP